MAYAYVYNNRGAIITCLSHEVRVLMHRNQNMIFTYRDWRMHVSIWLYIPEASINMSYEE
jgi:hypothetical protein